jgi:hypothetical protein
VARPFASLSPWLAIMVALALPVAVAACADEIQDPRSADVDFRDPKSVTGSIFYAAETGKTAHLAGLCDPTGAGDDDTRRICSMHAGAPDWESFRASFARAHLNGEPRVSGDHARLELLFGPGGRDRGAMELVRRGGRWYLSSF